MKTSEKTQQPEDSVNDQNRSTLADEPDWTLADPKGLKVKPEFQRLIPLQSKGELTALEESIKVEGCRDPIVVWKGHGIVLDGHTRRELASKHKQQVKVREVELPDEQAAIDYILQIQRQRRNLTREALSYLRGAEYNALKQSHGGSRRGRKPKDHLDPLVSTAQRLAQKYGVGAMTIKRDGVFAQLIDKLVAEYGDPEAQAETAGCRCQTDAGPGSAVAENAGRQAQGGCGRVGREGGTAAWEQGNAVCSATEGGGTGPACSTPEEGRGARASVLQQMAKLLGMEVAQKGSNN